LCPRGHVSWVTSVADLVNQPILVIAEVGVNHNGDLDVARRLIDVAKAAGADIVKFQTFVAHDLATQSATQAAYQTRNSGREQSQVEMLQALEMSREMHAALTDYCRTCDIEFLSTAFDTKSLSYLVNLGIKRIKIPSGELTNLPYLQEAAAKHLPIILSTGMATIKEVRESVGVLIASGVNREDLTVLHCTSNYPAPLAELNLAAMQTMHEDLGLAVGYSDHSSGVEAAILAVALGAKVLEKHITLDRSMPGPDHLASVEPQEFKDYVRLVRNAQQAMGDGIKRPSKTEMENAALVRKSIVAAKPIKRGELFSPEKLTTKRPGTGISPMRWHEIIGKPAARDFAADELIET